MRVESSVALFRVAFLLTSSSGSANYGRQITVRPEIWSTPMAIGQAIYTNLKRGEGKFPEKEGFQFQALSGSADRAGHLKQLEEICTHLGETLQGDRPHLKDVREKEMSARARAGQGAEPPEEVLASYPEGFSCDRIAEGVFAFSRVIYTGLTPDQNNDNYLVHSLVYTQEDLSPSTGNMLRYAGDSLFRKKPLSGNEKLDELPALPRPKRSGPDFSILKSPAIAKQLPGLVMSLVAARNELRPLVICLASAQDGPRLLEALLDLLPPTFRGKVTFTTTEINHRWKPRAGAPRQVMVMAAPSAEDFSFEFNDYTSDFVIFNFVEGQFSDVGAPGPFAEFAARCALQDRLQALSDFHELLESLNVAADTLRWDTLAPAEALLVQSTSAEEILKGLRAVVVVARGSGAERHALDIAIPLVGQAAQTMGAEDYERFYRESWPVFGKPLLLGALEKGWDEEAEKLTTELLGIYTEEASPATRSEILLMRVEMAGYMGDRLLPELEEAAHAGVKFEDRFDLLEKLREGARRFENIVDRALAQARLTEITQDTTWEPSLLEDFRKSMRGASREDRQRICGGLAESGAVHLLSSEIIAQLTPWHKSGSMAALEAWWKGILQRYHGVLDQLCIDIAERLEHSATRPATIGLAGALLKLVAPKEDRVPGVQQLVEATIGALPLKPLRPEWDGVFLPLLDITGQRARARLFLLKFMREVEEGEASPDWSPAMFPYSSSAWKGVPKLATDEQRQAVGWFVGRFELRGLFDPQEARAFIGGFHAVGQKLPIEIARGIQHLLRGRDPITRVLVLIAFARLTIERPEPDLEIEDILKAALKAFDKGTRFLFEEHLLHRFRDEPTEDEKEREVRLFEELGFRTEEKNKPEVAEGGTAERLPRPVSVEPTRKSGIFQSIRKFMGGREE